MSGRVYVIHCSLPTALRKAACSSVERSCSWSAVAADFREAVPGADAGLHVDMLFSSRSLVVYSSGNEIS